MPPANISIYLVTEDDAPILASVMTTAFAASDRAYPLIWGSAQEGTHDMVAEKALFSPVQKEGRVTYKAVDTQSGRMVGFATWNIPKAKVAMGEAAGKEERKGWLPELPGVNMELRNEKTAGPKQFYERDVDPSKDILLSFFFVHPYYQCQGIGFLLLERGKERADELHAKTWISSTPQAVSTYERNGWKVVDRYEIDLVKYGGEGTYTRAWMLRVPKDAV